jgi:hypothetical protein
MDRRPTFSSGEHSRWFSDEDSVRSSCKIMQRCISVEKVSTNATSTDKMIFGIFSIMRFRLHKLKIVLRFVYSLPKWLKRSLADQKTPFKKNRAPACKGGNAAFPHDHPAITSSGARIPTGIGDRRRLPEPACSGQSMSVFPFSPRR